MLDAVWGVRVAQNDASVFLYATSRKSILENVASGQVAFTPGKDEQATLVRGMLWLQNELSDCRIPHRPDSAPDWFSLETVWCKHLSHRHGSYPLLNDTFEIGTGSRLG